MKRKVFKIFIIILATIITVSLGIYFFFPQYLLALTHKMYERDSNLTSNKVTIDGYDITYYEGGKGEPLVLIHGFSDSKMSFVQSAKWLSKKYRVILPEVPGFGISKHDTNRKYDIRSQVEFFDKLFTHLNLTSFHLGGNSMGGHISVAYTLRYPEKVSSLVLLNAAGVRVTKNLPYQKAEKAIQNEEEFEHYLNEIFYEQPYIPQPIKSYLIAQSSKNFEWFNTIREHIQQGEDFILNDHAHHIEAPTILIWGDHDTVVVPKVGELYDELIPNSQFIMMEKCGHVPQYERPEETSTIILEFLEKLKK